MKHPIIRSLYWMLCIL